MDLFVITNGSHWNGKIEKLINELNFDVAISIDAFDKEKVERIRKNVVYEKLMDNIHRFSEICNSKGKHLSLSFTVQKDNWEQLPLIINLCNKVNSYIYVSYLERPVRFAIADLSKDELQKIRDYMQPFSFPTQTQKEKHNAKCFEDFKHYLDIYIETADTKKYHDYEFNRNQLLREELETKQQLADMQPASYSEIETWISTQYETDATFTEKIPKEILLRQLNAVLKSYNEEDQNLLHALIMQGSFEPFLQSIKNSPIEELKKMSSESLAAYRKLALVAN